jgi:hypothetical protein
MAKTNGATVPGKAADMGSGTAGGLMAFFDYLVDKGIATSAAITPLKSAARQIFEIVEGREDFDDMDVRSLDVDEYLDRFRVKAIGTGRYKPDSIASYRSRFARGIDYYKTYLQTGNVPKFKLRGAPSTPGPKRQTTNAVAKPASAASAAAAPVGAAGSPGGGTGLISYPFPLQAGGLAHLHLPLKLDRADAERMAAFIRTLVFEPQKSLNAGTPTNQKLA